MSAYLALAYGDTPPIVPLAEPENGLHPALLHRAVDVLRKMTTDEIGNRKRQVIVTTHSPVLLIHTRPAEMRVLYRGPSHMPRRQKSLHAKTWLQ